MSISDRISLAVSSLLGVGYVPLCPGSAASFAGVLVFIFLKQSIFFTITVFISIAASFYFTGRAEEIYAKKDDKRIVIDDFSGQLITYLFIPADIRFIICGFFLFRMFDMLKIPPANRLERCPGALGITGDDVVAGIYACVCLHIVKILLHI